MKKPLKIKVNFENETKAAMLNFIAETQEGKYTKEKPDLTQIIYKRLQIQEQDKTHVFDESSDDFLLFGISS